MRRVLFIGGVAKNAQLLNDLHTLLVRNGHAGLLGIFSKIWDHTIPITFPSVELNHLSHFGAGHVIRNGEDDDLDTILAMTQRVAPIDVALLWNGSHRVYYHWRKAFEEHDIPTIFCENSGIPDLFAIDPSGINGASMIARQPLAHGEMDDLLLEKYLALFYETKTCDPPGMDDAADAFISDCRAEGRKVILYLGLFDQASGIQDQDAAYAKATSPWYHSSQDALRAMIHALDGCDEKVAVIIKAHPSATEALSGHSPRFPVVAVSPRRQVMDLMTRCDVVATIASTLSYTAVALGKPLLLMGRNLLSNKGIAYEVTAPAALSDALRDALRKQAWGFRLANGRQFIWNFVRDYPHYTSDPYLTDIGAKPVEALVPMLEKAAESRDAVDHGQNGKREDAVAWHKMMHLIVRLDAQTKSPRSN
jgi:hypothetical protein